MPATTPRSAPSPWPTNMTEQTYDLLVRAPRLFCADSGLDGPGAVANSRRPHCRLRPRRRGTSSHRARLPRRPPATRPSRSARPPGSRPIALWHRPGHSLFTARRYHRHVPRRCRGCEHRRLPPHRDRGLAHPRAPSHQPVQTRRDAPRALLQQLGRRRCPSLRRRHCRRRPQHLGHCRYRHRRSLRRRPRPAPHYGRRIGGRGIERQTATGGHPSQTPTGPAANNSLCCAPAI